MLCSRCKKRPAVVFIATNTNSSNTQGLCLTCAKELGIKPVTDLMDKMGIDDEQLEAMQEQFGGLMNPEELGEAFGAQPTGKKRTTMPCLRREERRHFHFYKIFLGTLSKREAMPRRTPMLKSLRKKSRRRKSVQNGSIWIPTAIT